MACEGTLAGPLGPGEPDAIQGTGGPKVRSTEGSGDFATGNFDAADCEGRELHPGVTPGLVRLTHRQYENAVRDVLGLDARAVADFVDDQVFFGFDNNAENLSVPKNQVTRYQATAERLAAEAAQDLSGVARVVPCVATSPDASCRDAFVRDLVALMLRRPLTSDERTRYTQLFDAGATLYEEGDAFARGVRIVLEAALQSPAFLYRAELRDAPLDGAVVPLSSHELAARLALTLWASVPDRALMDKANADALSTDAQIEAEARRMLDDAKAARVVDDFHAQWLELEKLRFSKDPLTFPEFDEAAFRASAEAETRAFVRHVALEQEGSIGELFTSSEAFVDATLAPLYGVPAPASGELTRVSLDPEKRAGLFTQLAFLAGHADALDSSPIHRGAYVQKRVLCTVFGSLPANVGTLPAREGEIVTTRDQVEAKTEPPQCAACHDRINPAGFAFEGFDTLGRERTLDHGAPIDTTGALTLDGEEVSFDGAVAFAHALADSATATRCYETQWFRYSYGRGERNDDVCLLHEIDTRAKASGYGVKEMLVALTLSRGFRFRAQEDL